MENEIDVELLREHEDGSATYIFHLSPEQTQLFLINGVRAALIAGIEEAKKWKPQDE